MSVHLIRAHIRLCQPRHIEFDGSSFHPRNQDDECLHLVLWLAFIQVAKFDDKAKAADKKLFDALKTLHAVLAKAPAEKLKVLNGVIVAGKEGGKVPPEAEAVNAAVKELQGILGAGYKVVTTVVNTLAPGAPSAQCTVCKMVFKNPGDAKFDLVPVTMLEIAGMKESKNLFQSQIAFAKATAELAKAAKAVPAADYKITLKKRSLQVAFGKAAAGAADAKKGGAAAAKKGGAAAKGGEDGEEQQEEAAAEEKAPAGVLTRVCVLISDGPSCGGMWFTNNECLPMVSAGYVAASSCVGFPSCDSFVTGPGCWRLRACVLMCVFICVFAPAEEAAGEDEGEAVAEGDEGGFGGDDGGDDADDAGESTH